MAEAKGDKFVVCHTMVEDWPQGTVLTAEQLQRKGDRDHPDKVTADMKEHLLSSGAIRPARGDEAAMERVPVPAGGLSTAAQMRLASLDAQAETLTRAVAALEEKLAFHKAAAPQVAAQRAAAEVEGKGQEEKELEDPALQEAIRRREEKIKALEERAEAIQGELSKVGGGAVQGGAAPVSAHAPPGAQHPHGHEAPKKPRPS